MLAILTLLILFPLSSVTTADEPVDFVGNWTWEWKDDDGVLHQHVMEVKRDATGYVAVERFDDEPPIPVRDLTVDEQSVKFETSRGIRTSSYEGRFVDQKTIRGEVTVTAEGNTNVYSWTAKRLDKVN